MHTQIRATLLFLLTSPVAWAQTASASRAEAGSSYFGGAWVGLVTLALLVGLLALLLWFFRTYGNKNMSGPVQVLASQPLGPRDRILIVRIEDRILALGQTPSQISLLTELESFDDQTNQAQTVTSGFAGVLDKALKRAKP